MSMSEQQYETILGLMADKIKEQEGTINFQKIQLSLLKEKLDEAEYHLNPHGEKPKTLEIR